MQQLTIIKIGGNIIDDEQGLKVFVQNFAGIQGAKLLVHGGGKIATEIGNRLGIESKYVDGRRVTDAETLDLVTMVYGGLINKKLVAMLQQQGCNTIGLTGTDGNLLKAVKRSVTDIDYGFAGDVVREAVNIRLLQTLLQADMVPVIAPLTHDGKGSMLNTNADTIAQEIASATAMTMNVKLIYCFDKKGLLSNIEDECSVIAQIDKNSFEALKDSGVISHGMIPKVKNALAAIDAGISRVAIGHADDLAELISGKAGTQIQ